MRSPEEMVKAIRENGCVLVHTPAGPKFVSRIADIPDAIVRGATTQQQLSSARSLIEEERMNLLRAQEENTQRIAELESRLSEFAGNEGQEVAPSGEALLSKEQQEQAFGQKVIETPEENSEVPGREKLPSFDVSSTAQEEEDSEEEDSEEEYPTVAQLNKMVKEHLINGAAKNFGLQLEMSMTKPEIIEQIKDAYKQRGITLNEE